MNAYSYNDEMQYIGTVTCQLDPVRSQKEGRDIYLLPANATWTEPPAYDHETEIPVWDGESWTVAELPEEPEPEEPETPDDPVPSLDERVTALENAIEKGLSL